MHTYPFPKVKYPPYFTDDIVGNCAKPMGMESGAIKDNQLSASSSARDIFSAWEARRARLNNGDLVNAWMPDSDNVNQYIEVRFYQRRS